ncbi:MAG: hypothetical protein J5486_01270 [Bacteroidaceae bacterium]|nr:hypothetical protein [Bacteroidaceae bacterium]
MAEANARYVGIRNVSSEKVAKIIRGVEQNAQNIFDEVRRHLHSSEEVIAALESDADLNMDARGYFAAFELNYYPERGTWFEPYIYQPDVTGFEYKQVGSARHNYIRSPWYIRAKKTNKSFWSDPYFYYDGTSMSGQYSTYIKPIYDDNGQLACVCGADIKFDWLAKELAWVDEASKNNNLLNNIPLLKSLDYYSVILDNEGSCLANPEDKALIIGDRDILKDMAQKRSGIADLNVNGIACKVFYGPIEFVDWTLAVIVPVQDIWQPLFLVGGILLLLTVIGLLIVWLVCRRVLR